MVRTTDFGAFVELAPGKDGMVHISELADYHVPNVEDVVKVGDEVEVLVTEIDQTGRVRLSRKALLNGSEEGATIGTDGAEDTSTRRARPNRRPRSEDSNRPRSDSRKRPGRRRPEGSSRRQER